ncbi:MAG: CBS domain-containing protein [Euryarchaeota archaeon]|nr:CBS domain-containing protein [Euryarchaeota archaeon]
MNLMVKDVMQASVVTLRPTDTLEAAIRLFTTHRISGAPVVNDSQRLVGVLSEADVLKGLAAEAGPASQRVADYMTRSVRAIRPEDTLDDAAYTLFMTGFNRLPVVQDGKVVGIVTRHDLIGGLYRT